VTKTVENLSVLLSVRFQNEEGRTEYALMFTDLGNFLVVKSRRKQGLKWSVSVYYSLFVSKTKKILRNCESEKCIFLELDASCGNKTRNDSTWLT